MDRGSTIQSPNGYTALLHDDSIFDETGAQYFRDWMLKRLFFLGRFINQLNHFPEEALGHAGKFSISILGKQKDDIDFLCISNVFHPKTIDESFKKDKPFSETPKIKDTNGWVLKGHPNRLIKYDQELHEISKRMFIGESEDLNIPIFPIYANTLVELIKITSKISSLGDVENEYKGKATLDENSGLKSGIIKKETFRTDDLSKFILSAPHFYVGNPIFKQPNKGCKSKGDYNSINLSFANENFIPRALFLINDQEKLNDIINSEYCNDLNRYRLAWRTWVSSSNERTLICTVIPPQILHIYPVHGMSFSDYNNLVIFYGLASSIVYDFLIRITGIDHVWDTDIFRLPFPKNAKDDLLFSIKHLALKLICVTKHYGNLWRTCRDDDKWNIEKSFRSHLERRNALVSLDVLSAISLGISLVDLKLLYTTQFPTLYSNENETYYDGTGRIVFTINRGYSGVGFPRKKSKTEPIGWEDIKDMQSGTVERTIIDDTQPGGPVERTITYHAPFDRCDREKDYEEVWHNFEKRF